MSSNNRRMRKLFFWSTANSIAVGMMLGAIAVKFAPNWFAHVMGFAVGVAFGTVLYSIQIFNRRIKQINSLPAIPKQHKPGDNN